MGLNLMFYDLLGIFFILLCSIIGLLNSCINKEINQQSAGDILTNILKSNIK